MKTVYYAYPIALYGTEIERADIATLQSLGFKVLNPAQRPNLTMDRYIKLTCSCDMVAFRSFPDGKIGSGVGLELDGARKVGIPIIELSGALTHRYLTRNETRARMGLPKLCHPAIAPFGVYSDSDDYSDQDWGSS